jgi:pyrroloquinoline quinone (PQQ) biosynthesis protein C
MSSHPLYTELLDTARESVRRLDHHPVAGRLMQGTLPAAVYVRYLAQVRRQIRGSAPMLAQTGSRLRAMRRGELSQLFLRKAGEEDGHDAWALSDIEQLGVETSALERECSFAAVDAYIAWTSYCVQLSPVAVLGVAWILEWFGLCRAGMAADAMTQHSGIPHIASAVRFLRGHADADGAHVQALGEAVRQVTDPGEAQAILLSARVTANLYASFFEAASRGLSPS